jgi:DMSO/TMAO reductase YedYZ heme-binding membrane subunit
MDISVVDISSFCGLTALCVLTFNFLLGLMLSSAYKRSVLWKKMPPFIKATDIEMVHNRTAYIALFLVLVHPLLLLGDKTTKFRLVHILLPFNAPHQAVWVSLGVLSLYAVLIVIITTQKKIKSRLGFRAWKNLHLISYFTALLMCIHGLFLDPELKDRQPDFLDGEKLLTELCFIILISASIVRYRYYLNASDKKKTFEPKKSRA